MRLSRLISLFLILLCTAAFSYAIGLAWISGRNNALGIVVSIFASAALLYIAFSLWLERQAYRRASVRVLDQLEQCILLNLPLPRALAAMDAARPHRYARNIAAIPEELSKGQPLAETLRRNTMLPTATINALAAAESRGQLDQVVPALADQRRRAAAQRLRAGSFYRVYPYLVLTVLLGVLALLRVFVGPKFVQIFRDFRQPMPWISQVSFSGGGEVADDVIVALMLLSIIAWLWRSASVSSAAGISPSWLTLALQRLPIWGVAGRNLAWADAFGLIAESVERQRTLPDAIAAAETIVSPLTVHHQLAQWRQHLQGGLSIDDAARRAGLPRLLVGMLGRPASATELGGTLRFAADHHRALAQRRMAWFDMMLAPAVALSMGVLVAWVALSVFLPMTALIDAVNTRVWVVR